MSYNDKFFVCISNNKTPICFINDYLFEFKNVNCEQGTNWSSNYKVLYFKETDDFMLISRTDLVTTVFNNANNSIKICSKKIFSKQEN